MRGQLHTPAALYPQENPVPIVHDPGWASGSVWTGAENLTPTGILSPDRPARSQPLYRLSYRAHMRRYRFLLLIRKFRLQEIRTKCTLKKIWITFVSSVQIRKLNLCCCTVLSKRNRKVCNSCNSCDYVIECYTFGPFKCSFVIGEKLLCAENRKKTQGIVILSETFLCFEKPKPLTVT